jgi:defect-in-organelle-trafficking protein DotD
MKFGKLVVIVSILGFLLSGCSTKSSIVPTSSNDRQIRIDAEAKLAEAAASISNSLTELASIEKSNQKTSKLRSPVDSEMVGMNQLTSIDWSGPVEPLVRKLAGLCNYQLKVLGTEPGIPVLVSITAKDMTVSDILRNINFQCASKANIEIYPASRIIELRYTK